MRLLRRRRGFAHGEIPQTGGGPILHSLSLAPTEADVSPTTPPLSASPRGLGRCHAPCSAPFGVSTRAGTLSRPLLRPFRRPRGLGRCHAPCSAPFGGLGRCSAPFAFHGLGGVGETGKGLRTAFGFCFKVVQVKPELTFTEKKLTAHKDRWKSNCSLN